MLRRRNTKDPLRVIRQLDAFPKVPEEYQQSTKIGGTRKHYKFVLIFICCVLPMNKIYLICIR